MRLSTHKSYSIWVGIKFSQDAHAECRRTLCKYANLGCVNFTNFKWHDSESTTHFERQCIYLWCTFSFINLQTVYIHIRLGYTLQERSFLKNRDTLISANNWYNTDILCIPTQKYLHNSLQHSFALKVCGLFLTVPKKNIVKLHVKLRFDKEDYVFHWD